MKKILWVVLAAALSWGVYFLYQEDLKKKALLPSESKNTVQPSDLKKESAQAVLPVEDTRWTSAGPYGGNIKSIVLDGEKTIYAGTDGAGVFKSDNLGEKWVPVNNGLAQPFVTSMAMTSDGTLWAGTKEGIYKKKKGEDAWSFLSDFPKNWIPAMAVDKDDTMYASVWGTGVYVSKDAGATWTNRSEGLAIPFLSALAIGSSDSVYGGSESGIYEYHKDKKEWTHNGLVEEIITSLAVDREGNVYTGAWGNGVFKFKYDGKEWSNISQYIGSSFVKSLLMGNQGEIYAGTEVGVYLMENENKWTNLGPEGNVIIGMAADSQGNLFGGSTGNGFFIKTDKEKSFEPRNFGITNYNITKTISRNEGEVVGTYFSLQTLEKDGSWNEIKDFHIKNARAFLPIDEDTLLIGSGLGVFKGNPFKPSTLKAIKGAVSQYSITSFTSSPDGTIFAGTEQDGIYMSEDQGESWIAAKKNLVNNVVHVLMTDGKGRVYATTNIGVHQWEKEGGEWKNVSGALKNWAVKMMIAHPDGSMFAGVDRQGVFFKADDSSDWVKINEGLANKRMNTLAISPDGTVYAGTQGGLFQWSFESESWSRLAEEIFNPIIQTISFDKDGKMIIGTWGAGLFRQNF